MGTGTAWLARRLLAYYSDRYRLPELMKSASVGERGKDCLEGG